jgi:hypothetical protein
VVTHAIQRRAESRGVTASIQRAPGPRLPGSLRSAVPSVGYYASRNADFKSRYPTSPPAPPSYYLSYGDKYARRFTTVLKPTLSGKGQAWVDMCFQLLQESIENRRDADPAAFDQLEQNDTAFKSFAYATHPRAYQSAGLKDLPVTDLARIASTPDLGDLMTIDGVKQIVITGAGVGSDWASDAYSWVRSRLP